MLACRGRIVVMGMGKSGHVGRKIAATLASTGTPAFFVHPAEASHGDLGMVTPGDVVLAISNSRRGRRARGASCRRCGASA
jgi:arabinose-5-phosphate isomerase